MNVSERSLIHGLFFHCLIANHWICHLHPHRHRCRAHARPDQPIAGRLLAVHHQGHHAYPALRHDPQRSDAPAVHQCPAGPGSLCPVVFLIIPALPPFGTPFRPERQRKSRLPGLCHVRQHRFHGHPHHRRHFPETGDAVHRLVHRRRPAVAVDPRRQPDGAGR